MVLSEIDIKCYRKMLEDNNFMQNYFVSFLDRFVYTAADIEQGLSDEERKEAVDNLLKAFNVALDFEGKMSPYDFQTVANIINEPQGYSGFRKINVSAGNKANWTPVPPQSIYSKFYIVLDNYYNLWSGLENIYEREAKLHIEMMRIHPLEDGNKRLLKIILNANLVKAGFPPVIIDEFDTDDYYTFINNQDYEGFANFLGKKSKSEYLNVISQYKSFRHIPITESIVDYLQVSKNDLSLK